MSDVRQEHQYQGIAVTYLQQGTGAVNSLVNWNVMAIYQSLALRYVSFVHADKGESIKETKNPDKAAHSIAKLLNTRVWMENATQDKLPIQMEATSVLESFKVVEQL